jgi:surfeit locus 1 family protein
MTEAAPGAAPAARRSFPVGLTLAVAVALSILIALGAWQLQRLKWKEGVLAHIAALQSAKAVDIGPVLDRSARGAAVDFTRVAATCPGLANAPYLELYGVRDGQAGVRLISACQVASARYRSVLVDRGFIPDTSPERPKVDAAARQPMTVTGILRTPDRANVFTPKNRPGHWFSRDPAAMAGALNAPAPAPVFLFAETPTNPELPALVPAPLPSEIPNRHLEYALTWFGLAAALLGVYAAVLFRKGRA